MRRTITGAAGFFGLLAVAGIPAADAQENSFEGPALGVSASVTQSCKIDSVGELRFGELTEAASTGATAMTTLGLSCTMTNDTSGKVFVDYGLNSTSHPRLLKGTGGTTIRYQVCPTSACSASWSDLGEPVTISGGSTTKEVHAVINSTYMADATIADTYSDTLTVTLSY